MVLESKTTAGANTNTAVNCTFAAHSGAVRRVKHISWSYDLDMITAAVTGLLTVESPANTTLHSWEIIQGGPGFMEFRDGLEGASGQAIIITLSAVAAAQGRINAIVED